MSDEISKELKEELLKAERFYDFDIKMYKKGFKYGFWEGDEELTKHYEYLREKSRREGYSAAPDCIQLGYLRKKKK